MTIREAVQAGAAALLLLGAGQVQAATKYAFTTVIDSQRDGLEPTRCAAINDQGTVAVQVRDEAQGINMLITKSTATDTPVVIADTRVVSNFPTFCDRGITSIPSDPSINEDGQVAFQANLRRDTTRAECSTTEQRQRRQAILLGDGSVLTTIAHTINLPGGDFISEFLVADQSVNTSGQVAFVPELDDGDQGLYLGSEQGTFVERYLRSDGVYNGTSSRTSLNEAGQIAFQDSLQGSFTSGIFLSNPDGTFTTIVLTSEGGLASVSDPSLNNLGRVAFSGSYFKNGVQVQGLFHSRGGAVSTIADDTGPYASFREPSLNDLGAVAFTAELDALGPDGRQIQGVYTGEKPKQDVVLQTGDLYEGVLVTSVVSCSEALNNRGEIVMTVQSEDPDTFEVRTFIVKATPLN